MRWLWVLFVALGTWGPATAQNLESVLRPGDLVQGHAKWDEECTKCHVRFDKAAQDRLCMDCHKEVGADMRDRTGYHGRQKAQPCRSCHTDHKGRGARIVVFDKQKFDHDESDYALRGKHAKVACDKCHEPKKKYWEAPSDCNACHKKDDVHKGQLGTKCADCHNESDWKEVNKFDHDKTRFQLRGKHADAKCVDCHKKGDDYKAAPRTCIGCHKKDDDGAKGHKGSLGRDCAACHTEAGWKEKGKFDHDKTKFPLLGKHNDVKCADCHKSTNYKEAPKDCIGCHKKDDKHEATLGTKCESCHSEKDWKDVKRFDHDKTKFQLRNAHAAKKVQCKDCHKDLKHYRDTPRDCVSCHKKDDKHEGQLGTKCESCHGDRDWKVPRFDHAATRFPLVGKHLPVKCEDCHKTARYKDAPRDCWSCHKKDDKHKLKFGTACESCHNARAWGIWDYDHARRAKYVLDGAHRKVACETCHSQPAPAGKAAANVGNTCISCHRRDDVHDGSFGPACEQCHVTENWKRVKTRVGDQTPPPEAMRLALGTSSRLTGGMPKGGQP